MKINLEEYLLKESDVVIYNYEDERNAWENKFAAECIFIAVEVDEAKVRNLKKPEREFTYFYEIIPPRYKTGHLDNSTINAYVRAVMLKSCLNIYTEKVGEKLIFRESTSEDKLDYGDYIDHFPVKNETVKKAIKDINIIFHCEEQSN